MNTTGTTTNDSPEDTTDSPEELPEPNFIPLHRAPIDDEPPLPDHLQGGECEELGSEVSYEWDPKTVWESMEGVLVNRTAMRLGGTAYTFALDSQQGSGEISLVLLKKGGKIFDACMRDVQLGDRVYVRFRGLLPAKPGQNPARDWRVLKIKPV